MKRLMEVKHSNLVYPFGLSKIPKCTKNFCALFQFLQQQAKMTESETNLRQALGRKTWLDHHFCDTIASSCFYTWGIAAGKQASRGCDQSRAIASAGPVVPGPPFEIGASPFHVWPTSCCIYLTLYFKNVAPPFLTPPSGFWPHLLLSPGNGPGPK